MTSRARALRAKRGGALAAAMLFMLMVTIAGTALLSMSVITRRAIVRNGIDVRLMIACEAAVESVRGRFTLVQGVQENWNWLSSTTYTSLGTITINGIGVEVSAKRYADPSVPRAQVRGRASASGRTRVVEYTLRVAAFSDYAVYIGEAGASNWGYFKCVGNFYSRGSCNFGATGTQFFGNCWTSGVFTKSGNADPDTYTYLEGKMENIPPITMPDDIANYAAIENGAKPPYLPSDYVFYENTLEIQLMGTQFRRIFVRRTSNALANAPVPSWSGGTIAPTGYPGGATYGLIPSTLLTAGSSWLNTAGLTNASDAFARGGLNIYGAPQAWNNATVSGTPHSSLRTPSGTVYYELAWETLDLPQNGVIYVKLGSPAAYGSSRDSLTGTDMNRFTQQGTNLGDLVRNTPSSRSDSGRTPIVLLSGQIQDRRTTICCDGLNVVLRDNVTYASLAANPNLRREANKNTAAATAIPEMLGVISRERWSSQATKSGTYLGGGDINMAYRYWNLLPAGQVVTNSGTDTGHNASQNALDGVYLGTRSCGDNYYHAWAPSQEVWFCGGLISLYTTYYTENCWNFVHYDWDWRLTETTPPFFLSSYNVTAVFVPGTWRTWEE